MPTVTKDVTLEIIGEHLREARADIHGLKTDIMTLGDTLRGEIGTLRTEIDGRLDSIEQLLGKIAAQVGVEP